MAWIFLESIRVATACQAEVLILAGTGIIAGAMGVLDAGHRAAIARFHFLFLNPCICLQLNQYYSVERLRHWGGAVIILSVLHVAFGGAIGWFGGRILGFRSPRRELLILTTAFGNVGALPFVLIVVSICHTNSCVSCFEPHHPHVRNS